MGLQRYWPPHLCRVASYVVLVHRCSVLLLASSRLSLAADALAFQLALPLAGRAADSNRQVSAPCRAHKKKIASNRWRFSHDKAKPRKLRNTTTAKSQSEQSRCTKNGSGRLRNRRERHVAKTCTVSAAAHVQGNRAGIDNAVCQTVTTAEVVESKGNIVDVHQRIGTSKFNRQRASWKNGKRDVAARSSVGRVDREGIRSRC